MSDFNIFLRRRPQTLTLGDITTNLPRRHPNLHTETHNFMFDNPRITYNQAMRAIGVAAVPMGVYVKTSMQLTVGLL